MAIKSHDHTTIHDPAPKATVIQEIGDPDLLKTLYFAGDSETRIGFSICAMEIPGLGCVVRSATKEGANTAEALTFVPGARLAEDINGGYRLIKRIE